MPAPGPTHSLLHFSQLRRVLSHRLPYGPGLDFPEPKREQTRREGVNQHMEVGKKGPGIGSAMAPGTFSGQPSCCLPGVSINQTVERFSNTKGFVLRKQNN